MRIAEMHDNRITYCTLKPYKNHTKTHYYPTVRGCTLIESMKLKRFCGWVWRVMGVML